MNHADQALVSSLNVTAVHGRALDFNALGCSFGARLSEASEVWLDSHLQRILRAVLLLHRLVAEPYDVTFEPLQVHESQWHHTF